MAWHTPHWLFLLLPAGWMWVPSWRHHGSHCFTNNNIAAALSRRPWPALSASRNLTWLWRPKTTDGSVRSMLVTKARACTRSSLKSSEESCPTSTGRNECSFRKFQIPRIFKISFQPRIEDLCQASFNTRYYCSSIFECAVVGKHWERGKRLEERVCWSGRRYEAFWEWNKLLLLILGLLFLP
jgi:hypothetical protein